MFVYSWGRLPACGARRGAGRARSARTSLDLALDLRAQHARLEDLAHQIHHLSALNKRYVSSL